MKRRNLLAAGLALPWAARAAVVGDFPLQRPARAIMVSGGDYYRYQAIFAATLRGLAHLGLASASSPVVPEGTQSTLPMWEQLAAAPAGRIEFLSDGWYSYEWSLERRAVVCHQVLERIRTRGDVDLVLTFGTDAGRDMAHEVEGVPVVSLNSSDPVATGIVKSAEDSGKDNVHAMVTEDYWRWQLLRFYAIFRFRKLAIVTTEANVGRSGINDAMRLAQENGFQLVVRRYVSEDKAPEASYRRFREAVRLAIDEDGADAVYLTWFPARSDDMPDLVKLLTDRGVPAFAQTGVEEVMRGILLGVGAENIEAIGLFEARVIEQILNGVKPRDVSQLYAQDQGIVVNLKTAMQMGWQPPMGLLVTAEKTFTTQSADVR